MADVKKIVEIAIKVTGLDTKNIKGLSEVFKSIKTASDGVNESLKTVKTSLDKITAPKGLSQTVEALKGLKDIKGAANLKKVTDSLKTLSKVDSFPKLGTIAQNLIKLNDVNGKGVASVASGMKKLSSIKIADIAKRLTSLNTALGKLEKKGSLQNFAKFASDLSKLKTGLSGATKAAEKSKESFSSLGNVMERAANRSRTFFDAVRTIGMFRIASGALEGLKNAATQGVQAIAEFDQGLKDLQAITNATGFEVALMGKKILDVASKTKFSATEIASGMKVIAQSGFSASESIQTMQAVSDLATGTLSDLAQTVDLVTTAMRVFKIDASRSSEVADTFANAVNNSKLTIEKLRTAMNYLGPIARSVGVSFSELSTAMGTLANEGIRASTIGTGLRTVFSQLANPSTKLAEAANKAGVALADLDPSTDGLSSVISNLGLIVQDAGTAFDLFGKRGATAILSLVENRDKFDSMLDGITESGSASRQAAKQMEGLGVSFKNLIDKLGVLAIAIGDAGLTSILKGLVDVLRFVVTIFTDIATTAGGKLLVAIIGLRLAFVLLNKTLAVTLGLNLRAMLIGVASALGIVTTATNTASGAALGFQFALGPIGAILLAISAAITAGAIAYKYFSVSAKEASDSASELAIDLGSASKAVQDYRLATSGLSKGSQTLKEKNLALRKELLEVSKGFDAQSKAALKVVRSIHPVTGAVEGTSTALRDYQKVLNTLQIDALKTALEKSVDNIEDHTGKLQTFTSLISTLFLEIPVGVIQNFWNTFLSGLQGDWDNMWNSLGDVFPDMLANLLGRLDFLDLGETFKSNTKSWKEMQAELDSWDPETMTKAQIAWKEAFENTNVKAQEFGDQLIKIGGLDLRGNSEYLKGVAKDAGLAGDELKATLFYLESLKEAQSKKGGFDNIVEKWIKEGDAKRLEDLGETYNKLGDRVKAVNLETLSGYTQQKEAHKRRLLDLEAEAEKVVSAKKNTLEWEKSYHDRKTKILEDAEATQRAISKDTSVQMVKAYALANKELKEQSEDLKIKYEKDQRLRHAEMYKAEKRYQAKVAKIISGDLEDPKDALASYKSGLEKKEAELKAYYVRIAQEVANGTVTYERGEEKKKQASLQFYADAYLAAQAYFAKVAGQEGTEEFEKRQKVALQAEQKYLLERSKLLTDYNKEYAKAQKSIEKIHSKSKKALLKEHTSYKKDILAIETKLAKDLQKIEATKEKTLEKLSKEKIALAQKTADEIAGIEQDAQDTINGIKRRGETDDEKQRNDKKEASQKLSDGEALVAEALKTQDLDKLARGKALIKQAYSLSAGLENNKKAIKGVEDAEDALTDATNAEKKIKDLIREKDEQEALTKAKEETALAEKKAEKQINKLTAIHKQTIKDIEEARDLKLAGIDLTHRSQIKAEDVRHKTVMSNLQAEIDKAKTFSLDTTPKSSGKGSTGPTNTESAPVDTQATDRVEKAKKAYQDLADTREAIYNDQVIDAEHLTQWEIWEAEKAAEAKQKISEESRAKNIESSKGYYEGISDTNVALLKKMQTQTDEMIAEANTKLKESLTEPASLTIEPLTEEEVEKALPEDDLIVPVKVEVQDPDATKEIVEESIEIDHPETELSITIAIENEDGVNTLKDNLDNLPESTGTSVDVTTTGTDEVGDLKDAVDTLGSKKVEVGADVTGEPEVTSLIGKIGSLISKAVDAIANVKGTEMVIALSQAIDKLKDKTITITTKRVDSGVSAARANTGGLIDDLIPEQYANGGKVFRKLTNRYISSGSGHKDDVPAMLMKGEYVLKQSAVNKLGIPFLENLNNMRVDPSSMIPKFASGGYVGELFPGFGSMKKKWEEFMNPHGLTNGVAMKVGDPTFTDHLTTKVSKISTPSGAGFAKRMIDSYSDNVQKLASGGAVDTTTTFDREKTELAGEYNAEIKEAKSQGRTAYAQVLEEEKTALLSIAQDLQTTLATLKSELDEELASIKQDFIDTENALRADYHTSMDDIEANKKTAKHAYSEQLTPLNKELKTSKKDLQGYLNIASKQDQRLPGGGIAAVQYANKHFRWVRKAIANIEPTKEKITEAETAIASLKLGHKEDLLGFKESKNEAYNNYVTGHNAATTTKSNAMAEVLADSFQSVKDAKDSARLETADVKAEAQAGKADAKNSTIASVEELKKEFREALLELEDKWHVKNRKASGGSNIPKFANGGPTFSRKQQHIPGNGTVDDVPALLMKGEYVLRKDAVKKYGLGFLDQLNWGKLNIPRFADGGSVMASNVSDALSKVSIPTAMITSTPEGGGLESSPQAQEIIKHQINFTLGGKEYGPFTGDGMTMDKFITEMKIAQARA